MPNWIPAQFFDPNFWVQWTLAVIGVGTLVVLARTLIQIRDQAGHAGRQADAAERQLAVLHQPYVFFDGLLVEDFEDGKEPVFFANFRNEGTATTTITTHMKIKMGSIDLAEGIATIHIPAKAVVKQFLALGRTYSLAMKLEINQNGTPFCVQVLLKHGNSKEYDSSCMEYYPWADPRPTGVPLFVSCTNRCLEAVQPTPSVIDWVAATKIAHTTSSGIVLTDVINRP
jgi:hypothetical protein